jgi:hypothetical protein
MTGCAMLPDELFVGSEIVGRAILAGVALKFPPRKSQLSDFAHFAHNGRLTS